MSSCDGWPLHSVDVEHLPDRTMQLWLRQGESRASLGTVAGNGGIGHVVKQRVADRLGLTDPEFAVELNWPRPSYVRDGDRVTAFGGGCRTEGIVVSWIEGEVLVDPVDLSTGGGGLYAPENVVFPGDRMDG